MDEQRFDRLTRTLSDPSSRRGVLRRIGFGGLAAVLGGLLIRPGQSAAHHCTGPGCGCATGTYHPCDDGLVCCPSAPGTPGGAGICAYDYECEASDGSPDTCAYIGCGCATGTYQACYDGLVCCPSTPGLPGGPGICAPASQCDGYCGFSGISCPDYCNWGDNCPGCCSGFCGSYGSCA